MKKILILLFSISFLLSFVGCTIDNVTSDNVEETVQTKIVIEALPFPDIKLSIPEDYEITSSEHISEYYKKGDASVIVTSRPLDPNSANLDAIVSDAEEQYMKITDTFKEISSEDVVINSRNARIIETAYSIIGDENSISKGSCIGFIAGKSNLYIITCTAPLDEYSNHTDDFKTIIKSAVPLD